MKNCGSRTGESRLNPRNGDRKQSCISVKAQPKPDGEGSRTPAEIAAEGDHRPGSALSCRHGHYRSSGRGGGRGGWGGGRGGGGVGTHNCQYHQYIMRCGGAGVGGGSIYLRAGQCGAVSAGGLLESHRTANFRNACHGDSLLNMCCSDILFGGMVFLIYTL